MLLTIHNLPLNTQLKDVKELLLAKCGLKNMILDELVVDNGRMKITVGLAVEEDAAIMTRKINGLYYKGTQLYVQDVRQQRNHTEQPYHTAQQNIVPYQHNMQAVQPQSSFLNQQVIPGMTSSHNPGMAPPLNPGMAPPLNPGMALALNTGMNPSLNSGMAPPLNPGMAPQLNPSMALALNPAMALSLNSGMAAGIAPPVNPPMNQVIQYNATAQYPGTSVTPQAIAAVAMTYATSQNLQNSIAPFVQNAPWAPMPVPSPFAQGPSQNQQPQQYNPSNHQYNQTSQQNNQANQQNNQLLQQYNQLMQQFNQLSQQNNQQNQQYNQSNSQNNQLNQQNNQLNQQNNPLNQQNNQQLNQPDQSNQTNQLNKQLQQLQQYIQQLQQNQKTQQNQPQNQGQKSTNSNNSNNRGRDNKKAGSSRWDSSPSPQPSIKRDTQNTYKQNKVQERPTERPSKAPKRRWEDDDRRFKKRVRSPSPQRKRTPAESPQKNKFEHYKHIMFSDHNDEDAKHYRHLYFKCLFDGIHSITQGTYDKCGSMKQYTAHMLSISKNLFRKLVSQRLFRLFHNKKLLSKQEVINGYRAKFSQEDDKKTFISVVMRIKDDEFVGVKTLAAKDDLPYVSRKTLASLSYSLGKEIQEMKFGDDNRPDKEKDKFQTKKSSTSTHTSNERKPKSKEKESSAMDSKYVPYYNYFPNSSKFINARRQEMFIPVFPEDDPALYHNNKITIAKESKLHPYAMDNNLTNSLGIEVDILGDILQKVFNEEDDEKFKRVYDRVRTECCVFFTKQVLTMHLSKRLTSKGPKVVRINFAAGQMPSRKAIEQFLKPYNCIALERTSGLDHTDTYFDAHFFTYSDGDKVVNLKTAEITDGGKTLTLYLSYYIPFKVRKWIPHNYKNLIIKNHANILDKDWPEQEEIIKQGGQIKNSKEKDREDVNEEEEWEDYNVVDECKESDVEDNVGKGKGANGKGKDANNKDNQVTVKIEKDLDNLSKNKNGENVSSKVILNNKAAINNAETKGKDTNSDVIEVIADDDIVIIIDSDNEDNDDGIGNNDVVKNADKSNEDESQIVHKEKNAGDEINENIDTNDQDETGNDDDYDDYGEEYQEGEEPMEVGGDGDFETGQDDIETDRDNIEADRDNIETDRDNIETDKGDIETDKYDIETGDGDVETGYDDYDVDNEQDLDEDDLAAWGYNVEPDETASEEQIEEDINKDEQNDDGDDENDQVNAVVDLDNVDEDDLEDY